MNLEIIHKNNFLTQQQQYNTAPFLLPSFSVHDGLMTPTAAASMAAGDLIIFVIDKARIRNEWVDVILHHLRLKYTCMDQNNTQNRGGGQQREIGNWEWVNHTFSPPHHPPIIYIESRCFLPSSIN
jgi:hypothetical protein